MTDALDKRPSASVFRSLLWIRRGNLSHKGMSSQPLIVMYASKTFVDALVVP